MPMKSLTTLVLVLLFFGCSFIILDILSPDGEARNEVISSTAERTSSASPVTPDSRTSADNSGRRQTSNQSSKPVESEKSGSNDRKKTDTSPQTSNSKEKNLDILTQEEQIELGEKVAQQENSDDGTFNDAQVNRIAKRLIRSLPSFYHGPGKNGWQWIIRCKRTTNNEVNAIALPGGRIYVYDGILSLTREEDELAAVLAHEIIHVVEEHSAEKLAKSGKIKKITDKIVSKVNSGDNTSNKGKVASIAAALGQFVIQMHYSREDEFQADERGFQLLIKAGYNHSKALNIFNRLQSLETGDDPGVLGNIFSTHPPTPDRITNIKEKTPSYTKHSINENY